MDLRMVCFQLIADEIIHLRIPMLYHHQCFSVQIFDSNRRSFGKAVLSWHCRHLLIASEWQEITETEPRLGIAHPDQKIKFCPQMTDFRENALMVVFERNQIYSMVFRRVSCVSCWKIEEMETAYTDDMKIGG